MKYISSAQLSTIRVINVEARVSCVTFQLCIQEALGTRSGSHTNWQVAPGINVKVGMESSLSIPCLTVKLTCMKFESCAYLGRSRTMSDPLIVEDGHHQWHCTATLHHMMIWNTMWLVGVSGSAMTRSQLNDNRAYLNLHVAWAYNSSDPWCSKLDDINTLTKIDHMVLSQVSFSEGSYRHPFIPPTTTPHLTASRLFCHQFDEGTAKGLAALFSKGTIRRKVSILPVQRCCKETSVVFNV